MAGAVRRIVLGIHGLGGSMEDAIQRSLAEEMPLCDSAVIRFDMPAHGINPLGSEGFTVANCTDTLLAAAEEACRRFPRWGIRAYLPPVSVPFSRRKHSSIIETMLFPWYNQFGKLEFDKQFCTAPIL